MSIFIFILGFIAACLLVISSIAFLKAKDLFVMNKVILVYNFYIIPLILLTVELEKFSWISFAKTLVIIILNIIITNLLIYLITRRAIENKLLPDADFRDKLG